MDAGEQFSPREVFGRALAPATVRFSADLSALAKALWFTLAIYADVEDRAYPNQARLARLLGVGRTKLSRAINELEFLELVESSKVAGSRKRRFLFLWQPFYEATVSPPKKPAGREGLQSARSIIESVSA